MVEKEKSKIQVSAPNPSRQVARSRGVSTESMVNLLLEQRLGENRKSRGLSLSFQIRPEPGGYFIRMKVKNLSKVRAR